MGHGYDFVVNINDEEVQDFKSVLEDAARFDTIEGLDEVTSETMEIEADDHHDLSELRNCIMFRRGLMMLKEAGITITVE